MSDFSTVIILVLFFAFKKRHENILHFDFQQMMLSKYNYKLLILQCDHFYYFFEY